jgi:hypothetical protein
VPAAAADSVISQSFLPRVNRFVMQQLFVETRRGYRAFRLSALVARD